MKSDPRRSYRLLAIAAALFLAPAAALPQGPALDRTKIPPAGSAPKLVVPTWTTQKLSNGATLIVAERHTLPLVSFSITFVGGANQYEPFNRPGLAAMTSSMMHEGTTSKSGDQLSDAQQLLGIEIGSAIGQESGTINFMSTTSKFEASLALLTDMLLNPSFPADALERLRAGNLVNLAQSKVEPEYISGHVFRKLLYGNSHPYGRQVSEESIKAITRDEIMALHKAYFQPGHAIITVSGDVNAKTIKETLEKAFAAWPAAGAKPAFTFPALPESKPTTIYLIDKPGAAQSVIAIGLPGPDRHTPDYFPLVLLNRILGGHFQSRLNANIRELHGYSYGVDSAFSFGRGPGPFYAGGGVISDKTDASLMEFMKELHGVNGQRPITQEELDENRNALVQELPSSFESVSAIGGAITHLAVDDLPRDYYQNYAKSLSAVTLDDLARVAKKYIDMGHLSIVIVGDKASIETPLKATKIAPVVILDAEANPVVKAEK